MHFVVKFMKKENLKIKKKVYLQKKYLEYVALKRIIL